MRAPPASLVAERRNQPVESVVEAVALERRRLENLPCLFLSAESFELLGDRLGCRGVRQVRLLAKTISAASFSSSSSSTPSSAADAHPLRVRRVDDDHGVGVLVVAPPVRADRGLAAEILELRSRPGSRGKVSGEGGEGEGGGGRGSACVAAEQAPEKNGAQIAGILYCLHVEAEHRYRRHHLAHLQLVQDRRLPALAQAKDGPVLLCCRVITPSSSHTRTPIAWPPPARRSEKSRAQRERFCAPVERRGSRTSSGGRRNRRRIERTMEGAINLRRLRLRRPSSHTEQKERRAASARAAARAATLRVATREQIIATARLVLRRGARTPRATRRRQSSAPPTRSLHRRWRRRSAGPPASRACARPSSSALQSLLLQQQEGAAAPPPASPRAYSPLWSAVGSPTSMLSTPASRPLPRKLGYEPHDPAARGSGRRRRRSRSSLRRTWRRSGGGPPAGRRRGGRRAAPAVAAAVDPDDEPARVLQRSAAESLQHAGADEPARHGTTTTATWAGALAGVGAVGARTPCSSRRQPLAARAPRVGEGDGRVHVILWR